MIFNQAALPESEVRAMSPRMLAHLGDAVFHLYEREREIVHAATAGEMHRSSTKRASATGQATLLEAISSRLTADESDIVRRARNMKPQRQRRTEQGAYRLATAFEALLGYLYLTNPHRLKEVLEWTAPDEPKTPAGDA